MDHEVQVSLDALKGGLMYYIEGGEIRTFISDDLVNKLTALEVSLTRAYPDTDTTTDTGLIEVRDPWNEETTNYLREIAESVQHLERIATRSHK